MSRCEHEWKAYHTSRNIYSEQILTELRCHKCGLTQYEAELESMEYKDDHAGEEYENISDALRKAEAKVKEFESFVGWMDKNGVDTHKMYREWKEGER